MSPTPVDDRPGPRSVLDVRLPEHEDLLVSFVPEEQPPGDEFRVTVAQDRSGRRIRVPVGEQLEVTWQDGPSPRSRTAEVLEVDLGDDPTWRLLFHGPSRDGQRRGAVRAQLGLPVHLTDGTRTLQGTSLDLSETGLRGRWSGAVGWPDTDDALTATVQLTPDRSITGRADVRRAFHGPDGWLEASIVFTDLTEREQDQLRARVFERLRELARRGDR